MHPDQPSDPSLDFYERNAEEFAERTLHLDMGALYGPFLARLPAGARILDAGCGPGRDLKHFARLGFDVEGMDASEAMVRIAREHGGRPVHHLRFQEVAWEEEFDGIWASASLLHVPAAELLDVFERLTRALRSGGVWSLSFKHGTGERHEGGRRFTDLDEERLARLVAAVPNLRSEVVWRSPGVQRTRPDVTWLHAILKKVPA